jgi:hypothetical protein
MTSTLKDNPIWQSLGQTLQQVNPQKIVAQHLQNFNAQISGYWDDDTYYETVFFNAPLHAHLASSSWVVAPGSSKIDHHLQLKFDLSVIPNDDPALPDSDINIVGDLTLILDDNLEVIDENWLVNLASPYIIATQDAR